MSSERSIVWLGKEKEKKALELCQTHMKRIMNVTESMETAVSMFAENKGKFKEVSDKLIQQEREADETKSEILDELSKGSYPPLNREMIVRLIMTSDNIADNARAVAKKLPLLNPDDVDKNIREDLKHLAKEAHQSTVLLKETFDLLLKKPKEAIEKTKELEDIEEDADSFRRSNLTPKIMNWADRIQKPGTSHMLVEIESNIENVLDDGERSGDIIRELAIGTS